ncbi:unnamed protein product [Sympodiomycopsis kandeliae]
MRTIINEYMTMSKKSPWRSLAQSRCLSSLSIHIITITSLFQFSLVHCSSAQNINDRYQDSISASDKLRPHLRFGNHPITSRVARSRLERGSAACQR